MATIVRFFTARVFIRRRNSLKILNDERVFCHQRQNIPAYVTNELNSGKLSELLRYGDYAQSTPAIALRET